MKAKKKYAIGGKNKLTRLDKRIDRVRNKKTDAIISGNMPKATKLSDREAKLVDKSMSRDLVKRKGGTTTRKKK